MFYNTFVTTKSGLKGRNNKFSNGSNRFLNFKKRETLKGLLLKKYNQQYKTQEISDILDKEISRFVQIPKLNDRELDCLDIKIKKIVSNNTSRNHHISTLQNINSAPKNSNKDNLKERAESEEKFSTLQNHQELPSVGPIHTYNNFNSEVCPKRGKSSFASNLKQLKKLKTPEEELEELEKQLANDEDFQEKTNHNINRIDFSKDGNEWNAIVKYNRKLYEHQILEEKMKDKEIKNRIKECLDQQVKTKLQKKREEEEKDKEYANMMKEHMKKLDEISQLKEQKIKEQIQRLKENRDSILQKEMIKKRAEKLKEKKLDLMLVKNYIKLIEEEKKMNLENKKKKNEEMKRGLTENDINNRKKKERMQQEKEEELKFAKEKEKLTLKQDSERNRYYSRIKTLGEKYIMTQAQERLNQMKEMQKLEDEKIQKYYEEKNRKDMENEIKEMIKKNKEKQNMKKFLDMQIEEKKKEKKLEKCLDREQARIWGIDKKKYFDEEKDIEKKVKLMHKKNFDFVVKQMEENERKKKQGEFMTNDEYAINKKILEKIQSEK